MCSAKTSWGLRRRSALWGDVGDHRHLDEVGGIVSLHLAHHVPSMCLGGPNAHSEVIGNCSIHLAGYHEVHKLTFLGRQACVTFFYLSPLCPKFPLAPIPPDGCLYLFE